jgi:predicted nucleic acid-binding protein
MYVPDASVAAKWFRREKFTDHALGLLSPEISLHVPDLFLLEMDSIISKWTDYALIEPGEDKEFRDTLMVYPLTVHPLLSVRNDGYRIARITHASVYDCLYLALALRLNCKFVTADRKFHDKISPSEFSRNVTWIEDVPIQPTE